MTHNIDFGLTSSENIEDALSQQIEAIRLKRNMTQAHLSQEAGVSRSTITRLVRTGKGISLDSFIRILKALQLSENLNTLLPNPDLSPLEELEKENRPARQRARPKKNANNKWTWNDDSESP